MRRSDKIIIIVFKRIEKKIRGEEETGEGKTVLSERKKRENMRASQKFANKREWSISSVKRRLEGRGKRRRKRLMTLVRRRLLDHSP